MRRRGAIAEARGSRQPALLSVLALIVVATALGVVYSRFQARNLFVELQSLQKEREDLLVEWDKLQLEEGAFSASGKVEQKARKDLGMVMPALSDTKHVVYE